MPADKGIVELQAQLRGFGSGCTRRCDKLDKMIDRALAIKSPYNLQQVRECRDAVHKSLDDMEELVTQLDIVHEEGSATRAATLKTHQDRYDALAEKAQEVEKQDVPAAAQVQRVPGGSGQTHPGVPRSNDFLRPDPLEVDDKPSVLRQWKKAFSAYYKQHRMDLMSLDEQHLYFSRCLSKKLLSRIEGEINSTIPVLKVDVVLKKGEKEPPSCFKILDDEFLKTYPLVRRRRDAFEYKQEPGQKWSDMSVKLRELAVEGELQDLKFDQLLTYMHMVATVDPELRTKFFRMEEPELSKLNSLADAYESADCSMQGMDKIPVKVQAVGSQQKSAKSNCWRCNGRDRTQHGPNTCRFKSYKCHNCSEEGHIQGACKKAKAKVVSKAEEEDSAGDSKQQATANLVRPAVVRVVRPAVVSAVRAAPAPKTGTCRVTEVFSTGVAVSDRVYNRPTPRMTVQVRDDGGGKLSTVSALPDCGATQTIISQGKASAFGLKVNPAGAIPIVAADNERMECEGSVNMRIAYQGKEVYTEALVSSALKDDMLISWHDLVELDVLPPGFPDRIPSGIVQARQVTNALVNQVLVKGAEKSQSGHGPLQTNASSEGATSAQTGSRPEAASHSPEELKPGTVVLIRDSSTQGWDISGTVLQLPQKGKGFKIQLDNGKRIYKNKCSVKSKF